MVTNDSDGGDGGGGGGGGDDDDDGSDGDGSSGNSDAIAVADDGVTGVSTLRAGVITLLLVVVYEWKGGLLVGIAIASKQ
uniref:Uncharacterized protein n=1 Tax=Vespula pensylvanica TaxID=30213 RepID=A0A834P499_VESPE|nr:hypothetical protein H0235_007133 [Vespula pensylvanica]